jgi:coproporphyrinogen III oxidase-like Fe-S oxidoreductase
MRPLLGKEMEGSAVMGGAVIGGGSGAVIGGAVMGGQEASAELVSGMDGGGAKPPQKKKRTMSDKMKKRSEMIKSLMKGKGMTLAQASKHIKENKLM